VQGQGSEIKWEKFPFDQKPAFALRDRVTGANAPPPDENSNASGAADGQDGANAPPPALTGADGARAAERAEQAADRKVKRRNLHAGQRAMAAAWAWAEIAGMVQTGAGRPGNSSKVDKLLIKNPRKHFGLLFGVGEQRIAKRIKLAARRQQSPDRRHAWGRPFVHKPRRWTKWSTYRQKAQRIQ
jgi:hypothetical protein